jgi:hypothetical protein
MDLHSRSGKATWGRLLEAEKMGVVRRRTKLILMIFRTMFMEFPLTNLK